MYCGARLPRSDACTRVVRREGKIARKALQTQSWCYAINDEIYRRVSLNGSRLCLSAVPALCKVMSGCRVIFYFGGWLLGEGPPDAENKGSRNFYETSCAGAAMADSGIDKKRRTMKLLSGEGKRR